MPSPSPASRSYLDPRLTSLLEGLRARIRRYVIWDSVLAFSAVLLIAFWLGLLLDYFPVLLGGTEMPWLARLILVIIVSGLLFWVGTKMLLGRLRLPLPDDSLALLVERHHSVLGGRLVTAVQLSQPGRRGDSHSPHLLQHVHDEVATVVDQVDPGKVFRAKPLLQKAAVVGPLFLMAMILLAMSPQAFGRAISRLTLLSDEPWPRRADLEMVGVELPQITAKDDGTAEPVLVPFSDGVIRLPRGSSGALRIRAKADGDAELPSVCTVHYRAIRGVDSEDDGATRLSSGQSNMRRVGRVIDGYQAFLLDGPPLASLSDSVELDVRGLDDRLDGFRIEAVTPPAITEMRIGVRYPQYLRTTASMDLQYDRETTYQAGLRLAEGSDVTMLATSSTPLGDADVYVTSVNNQELPFSVDYSEDRRELRLRIDEFSTGLTVSIVPRDVTGISAQAPYRYFLGVVLDEPPELKVDLQGIGTAVTPIAKIPVSATVLDDYGVEQLTLSVTPSSASVSQDDGDEEGGADIGPSASTQPTIDRDGQAASVLDLRELAISGSLPELVPGDAVNVLGEASDRYNLDGQHLTRSEIFRLQIVTPENLLALLERRELALRARLEQTLDETRSLRDTIDLARRVFDDEAAKTRKEADSNSEEQSENENGQSDEQKLTRKNQVSRLRVQQSGLQASKTSLELSGIATSLDDILLEMVNNRVDSIDRSERIGQGVRDPLRQIVDGPLAKLTSQIRGVEKVVGDHEVAAQRAAEAVATAEDVLLQLTAVLEKMLDLESYNEILDMVRGLIGDQEQLLEDTKVERKKRVLDLFQ